MNINWTVNVWDLVLMAVAGIILYGRLVTIETKMEPIWEWWNESKGTNLMVAGRRYSSIMEDK